MAKSVECNLFQDGVKFLKNGGQKGPQVEILTPGIYRINTYLFRIKLAPVTIVPGGAICLVTAMDGAQIPEISNLSLKTSSLVVKTEDRPLKIS
jgi:hypothetical protein